VVASNDLLSARPGSALSSCSPIFRSLRCKIEALTGLVEARLEADGLPIAVTVEIDQPGMPEKGGEREITREWIAHFAISSPVRQEALKCVSFAELLQANRFSPSYQRHRAHSDLEIGRGIIGTGALE